MNWSGDLPLHSVSLRHLLGKTHPPLISFTGATYYKVFLFSYKYIFLCNLDEFVNFLGVISLKLIIKLINS